MKKSKNIFILFILFLSSMLFVTPAHANSCDALKPVLQNYYEASKNEDMDTYLSLVDMTYVKENMIENYEDYVRSAWEVYDTKDFKLNFYNCKTKDTDSLVYLNVQTSLTADGKDYDTARNYIATLHKINDAWKVRYIVDEDTYNQFQTSAGSLLFLDATKDTILTEMDNAEKLAEYGEFVENLDTTKYSTEVSNEVSSNTHSNNTKKGSGAWWAVILISILGLGAFLWHKHKNKS